ncbi:T9SS type A sorting domain-containing protein [Calditrichota bacterium]
MKYLAILSFLTLIPLTLHAEEQTIELNEGWNLVSFRVDPIDLYESVEDEGPSMQMVVDHLELDSVGYIEVIRDVDGNFNLPQAGLGSIDYWNLREAYWIKATAEITCTFEGTTIPVDTELMLREGLNLLPYYPSYELEASAPDYYVLSSILDYVIHAWDDHSGFFIQSDSVLFSNMDAWKPGEGYSVQVSQDVTFRYPSAQRVFDRTAVPTTFLVGAPYPNPFNHFTVVPFTLNHPETVSLNLYNIQGKFLRTLAEKESASGSQRLMWNAAGYPAGSYLLQINVGEYSKTQHAVYIP